jgi:hypothetical protein
MVKGQQATAPTSKEKGKGKKEGPLITLILGVSTL